MSPATTTNITRKNAGFGLPLAIVRYGSGQNCQLVAGRSCLLLADAGCCRARVNQRQPATSTSVQRPAGWCVVYSFCTAGPRLLVVSANGVVSGDLSPSC